MIVGVCRFELSLDDNFSLKGKRSVVKSLIQKSRNKFNVAMAEVEHNDVLSVAVIGFAVVGNDKQFINGCISKIMDFVETTAEAPLSDYEFQIEQY